MAIVEIDLDDADPDGVDLQAFADADGDAVVASADLPDRGRALATFFCSTAQHFPLPVKRCADESVGAMCSAPEARERGYFFALRSFFFFAGFASPPSAAGASGPSAGAASAVSVTASSFVPSRSLMRAALPERSRR